MLRDVVGLSATRTFKGGATLGIATTLFQRSLRRTRPAYAFVNPSAGGWVAAPRLRQAGLAVRGVMNVTRGCVGVLIAQLGCM